MAFIRLLEEKLVNWKNEIAPKPLIVRGARQVGKTTLIKEFAKSFPNSILLNLEKSSDSKYFMQYKDVKNIVEALFITNNISSDQINETLLFIDEIQESPEAIQILRYFYEEFPGLKVIAAGSLLEFAIKDVKSFPVGRVEFLYMYPLNFEEYLNAIGHNVALDHFRQVPVKAIAHQTLIDLFHQYAIIGGMPEVVSKFIDKGSISALPRIYESIWRTYQEDVEKYASNVTDRKVIKHIITTAHLSLDQRVKFQNFGNSNYRSREVSEAMKNLDAAKIIRLIYPTTDLEPPIKPNIRKSPRLQFLDTGIVNFELGIQADMLAIDDLNSLYKGALVPHLITQEVISINDANDIKPNFWVRDKKQSSAEVDLVFVHKAKVIPVEIKSGSTGTLKSLHQFIDDVDHPYAVRMYAGEFKIEEAKTPNGKPYYLMNLPYYLGTKLHEYIRYFLENY